MTEMSQFARSIMDQKYAHTLADGTKESWEQIADRVAQNVLAVLNVDQATVRRVAKLIAERKFIPGGRYLYASGRPFHQVQNCYDADTEIVTRYGTKRIGDIAGTKQVLMTTGGQWTEAEIRDFGEQSLMEVTLVRAGVEKTIGATPGHSWRVGSISDGRFVNKKSVTTDKLKAGDKLWSVYGYGIARTPISPDGVRHGIVWGDGNVPGDEWGLNSANVRLCGAKDAELLPFFADYNKRSIDEDTEVSGLPRHYKAPVDLTFDRSYLLGWLAGYFAADGCVSADGAVTISSCDEDSLKLVKDVCYVLGIGAYGIRYTDRVSNLTGQPSRLYSVALMRQHLVPEFFLISSHKARFLENPPDRQPNVWTVKSVVSTNRVEPVYCAVVPDTHEFVLADNILTGNCLLLRAEDSREGWSELLHKASMALMTGAGIGVDYSGIRAEGSVIHKTGGFATGPLALMQMLNEVGRGIMQGGSRRSAIWAGLNWKHPDIFKFIRMKDWSPEVRALKEKDLNFPATMDGTNISVLLDDEFFAAYSDVNHTHHSLANSVYWETVRHMLESAEPGFSVDVGENAGETLRNAPVSADTWVLTSTGYRQVGSTLGQKVSVWTGKQWALTEFKKTKDSVPTVRVEMTGGRSIVADPEHEFFVERYEGRGSRRKLTEIEKVRASDLEEGDVLHVSLPTGRAGPTAPALDATSYILGYTYGDGSFCKKYDDRAEVTFCTDESKKCVEPFRNHPWTVSITETDSRGYTRAYLRAPDFSGRSKDVFPERLHYDYESVLAGLFDSDGSYDATQNRIRLSSVHRSFLEGARRALETLGVQAGISPAGISTYGQQQGWNLTIMADSVTRFAETIPTRRIKPVAHTPYRKSAIKVLSVEPDEVQDVYCCDVGVKEHSFVAEGVVISNCTEITSRDDSDICNLGSINMAKIESLEDMREAVELGTLLLLAGTAYSHVPYQKVADTREKNRRLGLGLMGLHEWLLKRNLVYDINTDLERYLHVYEQSTPIAHRLADQYGLSRPVKTRAIAPTGTIGIVAETTTGLEPIFCVAYKRRYQKGQVTHYQYVIDPTAQRLIDEGVNPEAIEDAYTLAEDVERRVRFQAWLQKFVDHSISSTINLPSWGSELNNAGRVTEFGTMLMKYLPKLRGVTVYPDGSRGGQPLTPVKYSTAAKHIGEVFTEHKFNVEFDPNMVVYESGDICGITKGGSCGS